MDRGYDHCASKCSDSLSSDKQNKLRNCLTPHDLNKALNMNLNPMKTTEDFLPDLSRGKIFSVQDAKQSLCYIGSENVLSKPFGRSVVFWGQKCTYRVSTKSDKYLEGIAGKKTIEVDRRRQTLQKPRQTMTDM